MHRILMIDDDRKLGQLLRDYLSRFDFEVTTALDPVVGLQLLEQEPPDLVLLDLMLPDMDGFEVCRRIRAGSAVPIIMLTARGEVTDRVVGLELGADDYLPKPFEPRELAARMQAVLRRQRPGASSFSGAPGSPGDERIRYGVVTIDPMSRQAWLHDDLLDLTTLELDLLTLFVRNPGRVYTRDQLMQHLRGEDWSAFDRSVDVMVSRLRRKLGDDGKRPRLIKTVWGTGYAYAGGAE